LRARFRAVPGQTEIEVADSGLELADVVALFADESLVVAA